MEPAGGVWPRSMVICWFGDAAAPPPDTTTATLADVRTAGGPLPGGSSLRNNRGSSGPNRASQQVSHGVRSGVRRDSSTHHSHSRIQTPTALQMKAAPSPLPPLFWVFPPFPFFLSWVQVFLDRWLSNWFIPVSGDPTSREPTSRSISRQERCVESGTATTARRRGYSISVVY